MNIRTEGVRVARVGEESAFLPVGLVGASLVVAQLSQKGRPYANFNVAKNPRSFVFKKPRVSLSRDSAALPWFECQVN